MMGHDRGPGLKYWAMLLALSLALGAPAALAATTDFDRFEGFSEARQLSDSELGQQRGRFADKGRLMFFGVQMVSEWRTAAGDHLSAGAQMLGDLSRGQPTVSFQPTITVVESAAGLASLGNGATIVDRGTANASGVVQSIQAGGDFNVAANDLVIDVMDASSFGGVSPDTSGNLTRSIAGSTIAVSAVGNNMSVFVDIPGMGSISQAIVPGGGLNQAIQLSSNMQQVRNLTRLQLYMGNQAGVGDRAVPGMLSGIKSAAALR
ncbi:hypothetical protein [Halomonas sp.]|uniref:hypothetical protein n=1 Tax=Halomonas sp. TaxID=1486246 RepID=UPI00257B3D99|nr:hypothetical protein [Halomonas sp.]